MDLTCEDPGKVRMILIAYVMENAVAQVTAPLQVKVIGMRTLIVLMTGA